MFLTKNYLLLHGEQEYSRVYARERERERDRESGYSAVCVWEQMQEGLTRWW